MSDINMYKNENALMRSKVFFISMDREIEDEINNCVVC